MRLVPLPGVFRPHSDSWMLAALIRGQPLPPRARVLDLGSGSGVLALTAALRGGTEVTAVDVSRRALLAVRLSARANGVRVRARRGDMFAAVPGERFDLIVSNPPYLPGHEPPRTHSAARAWEGGRDGRRFLDPICRRAHAHLRPGGTLLLVHSEVCSERTTLEQLGASGLRAEVIARHRGTLGPRLMSRIDTLVAARLLADPPNEEMIFVRAVRVERGASACESRSSEVRGTSAPA